ncbi:hypothetical protein D3C84_1176670 [compost metagenome]
MSAFEHILQLPHIARKTVAFQGVEGIGVEFCRGLPGVCSQALEHMAGQRLDVVTAFAQRWHA